MVGVIGSLIFVGLQLRQTQKIAMYDAYQTRAYGSVETNMAITMSPTMLSAEVMLWAGRDDDLDPVEIVAPAHDFYGKMEIYESNHCQFNSGFPSEEHWQKTSGN